MRLPTTPVTANTPRRPNIRTLFKPSVIAAASALCAVGAAQAVTCGTYSNDIIDAGGFITCVASPATGSSFSATGYLAGPGSPSTGTNIYLTNTPVVVGSSASRLPYTWAGTALNAGGWDSTSAARNTLSATDVSLYLAPTDNTIGYSYAGAGAGYGSKVWLNNFTLDVTNANNGDMNGLFAGVGYGTKTPNAGGLINDIHVANNYSFTVVKGNLSNTNPTTGIRAIQNNDGYTTGSGPYQVATGTSSQAIVRVDGTYTANINSGYGIGVYVSGQSTASPTMPTVTLNNANITLSGSGNALKVGKTDRYSSFIRDGWGAGQLNFASGGMVNIDTSAATGEAIAIVYGGSVLDASTTASFNVNAQGSAIRIGNDILANALQASSAPITASFNNAVMRTSTATSPLIQVDPRQQDVRFTFTGTATDLAAPSNGYLINVLDDSNAANSSVAASFAGGQIAGLTNKATDTTLNMTLASTTWNLVEQTGGGKTSTFTSAALNSGSVLNAYTSGSAAFIMNGPVSASASTVNLTDGQANDVLTIANNYTASSAALTVDTCMGNDSAPSDVLVVQGDTSGNTTLTVSPLTTGAACQGALTTGNGILVVQVDGNSAGTFTLAGTTITQGSFIYGLVKMGNNWYLQSVASTTDTSGTGSNGSSTLQRVPTTSTGVLALLSTLVAAVPLLRRRRRAPRPLH
jgi:autotransporter family porin